MLEPALRNAARTTGTRVVLVNPAYTSQTCHACGHCASENRESCENRRVLSRAAA